MVVMVMEFMIIFWYVDLIVDRSTSEFLRPTSFMYRIRTSYTRISSRMSNVSIISRISARGRCRPADPEILGSTQGSLIILLNG